MVVEIADGWRFAGELFREVFGEPPPRGPAHYVAFHRSGVSLFRVVGYFHAERRHDYLLVGGLCVDPAYRGHGIGEMLEREPEREPGGVKALFAYAGTPTRAQRIGYQLTQYPHLLVKWLATVADDERERMIAEVADVGPF